MSNNEPPKTEREELAEAIQEAKSDILEPFLPYAHKLIRALSRIPTKTLFIIILYAPVFYTIMAYVFGLPLLFLAFLIPYCIIQAYYLEANNE